MGIKLGYFLPRKHPMNPSSVVTHSSAVVKSTFKKIVTKTNLMDIFANSFFFFQHFFEQTVSVSLTNPLLPSIALTHIHTQSVRNHRVPFVFMKTSVKNFHGSDHARVMKSYTKKACIE